MGGWVVSRREVVRRVRIGVDRWGEVSRRGGKMGEVKRLQARWMVTRRRV